MNRKTTDQVKPADDGQAKVEDPVLLRQQALIKTVRGLGYTNPQIEHIIGVGRPKPSSIGAETTGERIACFLSGKYTLSTEKHAVLCSSIFADAKFSVIDDFGMWRSPAPQRQAIAPFLAFCKEFGTDAPSRQDARKLSLNLQRQLSNRRRGERDQLVKIARAVVARLSKMISLLMGDSTWTNNHRLFAIKPWNDLVQLDVAGAGNSYFLYKWDQAGPNQFEAQGCAPQPCIYEQDESIPKERFQALIAHLEDALRRIRFDRRSSDCEAAKEIRKQARRTQSGIDALLRRMNMPRVVSWDVCHPICDLDDKWWDDHAHLSPILIRHKLANGQDWSPLPESLTAQPVLFKAEHNSSATRFLRFLELVRDAAATIGPDMMTDVGADLIGMDACKSLELIARHGCA